ncbi:transposase [Streptomyces diastaticus]
MAMRDYSDEFKADAVALYESTPGATYKSIAADLGINRNTLRNWVLRSRKLRSGVPDAARDARTVVRDMPEDHPGEGEPADTPPGPGGGG